MLVGGFPLVIWFRGFTMEYSVNARFKQLCPRGLVLSNFTRPLPGGAFKQAHVKVGNKFPLLAAVIWHALMLILVGNTKTP